MRSIARVFTVCRRSTSSGALAGSLRATSSSDCVIASGVRSSCEALAANRWCSATWDSSCSSMVSKTSASSRNSSARPGSRTRCDSDPREASLAASAIRVSGESIRPARNQPPTRPARSSNASATAAARPKMRERRNWLGEIPSRPWGLLGT